MNNISALLISVISPLLLLGFIALCRENLWLMLQLLAGTGIILAMLAWLQALGVFAFAGPSNRGTIFAFEDVFSFVGSALVSGAWVLALFFAVRGRATGWIVVLVVALIIGTLARLAYEYPGLILPATLRLHLWSALLLYAVGLLSGFAAFVYGTVRPGRGRPQQPSPVVVGQVTSSPLGEIQY